MPQQLNDSSGMGMGRNGNAKKPFPVISNNDPSGLSNRPIL